MSSDMSLFKTIANAHMRRDGETWKCTCEACLAIRSLMGVSIKSSPFVLSCAKSKRSRIDFSTSPKGLKRSLFKTNSASFMTNWRLFWRCDWIATQGLFVRQLSSNGQSFLGSLRGLIKRHDCAMKIPLRYLVSGGVTIANCLPHSADFFRRGLEQSAQFVRGGRFISPR